MNTILRLTIVLLMIQGILAAGNAWAGEPDQNGNDAPATISS